MLERNIGLIESYLDSMVNAALLGKIKDAACVDIGEQLFQSSTAKIFIANDCST